MAICLSPSHKWNHNYQFLYNDVTEMEELCSSEIIYDHIQVLYHQQSSEAAINDRTTGMSRHIQT